MKNTGGESNYETLVQHSLILRQVVLPEHPSGWPSALNLALGLKEFLILEGLSMAEAQLLLRLAATLQAPAQGQVLHWDQDVSQLSRENLFGLRRQIAYISPGMVLLHRLTVLENVTLAVRYFQLRSRSRIAQEASELLERLQLGPYQSYFPPELPEEIYFRVLWARALIKEPELILATPFGAWPTQESKPLIMALLREYQDQHQGAVLLAGPYLQDAYPLADRVLVLQSGQFTEYRFPGPFSTYLSFL